MSEDTNASPIVIWDRASKTEQVERVYGDGLIRGLYGSGPGHHLGDAVLARPWFSRIYGAWQSSPLSARKIAPFIREFAIKMEEYEDAGFASFNDFFIRKFKPGARRFAEVGREMPAFAEARYFAYEAVRPDERFPVKGSNLSPDLLLGSAEKARPFAGGPGFIARLCPTDYHRFHFPDDGMTSVQFTVHGKLHSVNPIALARKGDIFFTNERQVSILETDHFGKLAYIEVGAMCVGRIVQTHPGTAFKRGDEKGYFLFGGSTVIVLGEPGCWRPDGDLLEQSARGRECLVRLGERIATTTR